MGPYCAQSVASVARRDLGQPESYASAHYLVRSIEEDYDGRLVSRWKEVFMGWVLILLLWSLLAGCASNLKAGNLYTSNVFFLPPGAGDTIYLETRNTSDNQAVTLQTLGPKLSAKGYQLVTDPSQARYVVQTNTVYCNTEKQTVTMETMVAGGYGGGVGGTISSIGGAIGSIGGTAGMVNPMIGMGAAGISAVTGAVGGAIDSIGGLFGSNQPSSTEEVTYACVTDVQIKERHGAAGVAKGVAGPTIYQTRLVGGVHQKRLNIAEATPLIHEKLANGVAGNF